tara:strand:+ start:1355 stop:1864 length:510 start_codon:yes stop_codon:yes gene_type:complete
MEDMKKIAQVRELIYNSYDSLLNNQKQREIDFLDFCDVGDFIYYSDDIEDDEITGKSYFLGNVISRENIGGEGNVGIITRTEPDGIDLFENYSGRNFKPILFIPDEKGLVANLTALEKNPDKLEGYTPQEVIGLNFDYFPLLKGKHEQLSEEDYKKFYMDIFSKMPLFF